MGTQVRLTRSGGFAGISMVAAVDLDDVPAETAKAVRAALEEVDFSPRRSRSRGGAMRGAADMYQYDLEVIGEKKRSLTAHEPLADPGLQKLSEVLLPLARPE